MTLLERYFEVARAALGEVAATQADRLEAVARRVADSVAAGGVLHVFGAGHSQLLALDAYWRAGGLACVHPIVVPELSPAAGPGVGAAERLAGRAAAVLDAEDLRPGEVVLVISNSGVNAVPVEVAVGCRQRGLLVVALCNLEQAAAAAPRHPAGRLHEVADLVIDNRCPTGDAALPLAGGAPVGPLTTVVGAAVVAALAARVAELLAERGQAPPVLRSQNLDGDGLRSNDDLLAAYGPRTGARP
jgi:uncharacterized phosphosugar-binding protein